MPRRDPLLSLLLPLPVELSVKFVWPMTKLADILVVNARASAGLTSSKSVMEKRATVLLVLQSPAPQYLEAGRI